MNVKRHPFSATLEALAEEHLQTMSKVPWEAYSKAIRERAAEGRPAGDTFGCVVEGRYCDIGDSEMWVDQEGGDVRLVSYAVIYDADGEIEFEATKETVVSKG